MADDGNRNQLANSSRTTVTAPISSLRNTERTVHHHPTLLITKLRLTVTLDKHIPLLAPRASSFPDLLANSTNMADLTPRGGIQGLRASMVYLPPLKGNMAPLPRGSTALLHKGNFKVIVPPLRPPTPLPGVLQVTMPLQPVAPVTTIHLPRLPLAVLLVLIMEPLLHRQGHTRLRLHLCNTSRPGHRAMARRAVRAVR